MSEDLKAPRYRLVGYDIGTAPDENGGWVHWTDHEAIVARLTAERDTALAGAVNVKPLVWVDMIGRMKCEAETAVGRYAIAQDGAWTALWFNGSRMGGALPTIEAAKAAAKADYEARILAAIQPDPEARQEALAPTDYERKLAQMKRDFPNGI